jgi:hypothetical protein
MGFGPYSVRRRFDERRAQRGFECLACACDADYALHQNRSGTAADPCIFMFWVITPTPAPPTATMML